MTDADLQERYRLLHGDPALARAEVARLAALPRPKVIVSACLLGVRCRYDGNDKANPAAVDRFAHGDVEIVPLCPEVLGQLGIPRPSVILDGERALTLDGHDVTTQMDAGAELANALADLANAERALLKEKSPSCGVRRIHGLSGLMSGIGKFAKRLRARGVELHSEEDK